MWSLRRRFLLAALAVHVVVILAMLAATHRVMRDALNEQVLQSAARSRALLAASIAPLVVQRDLSTARELLSSMVADGVFDYAQVTDSAGRPFAQAGALPNPLPAPLPASEAGDSQALRLSGGAYQFASDLRLAGRDYGDVHFGISAREALAAQRKLSMGLLAVGAAGLALAGVIQLLLARGLTRRLEGVADAADRMAAGAQGLQLEATGGDESARLALSFNAMSSALEQRFTALQVSERRQRELVEALTEGVVFQDREDRVLSCNDAAPRILGLTREQLMGLGSFDPRWRAIAPDGSPFDLSEHPSVVARRTGRPVRDVLMGVDRPDGSRVWLSINAQPLIDPGAQFAHASVTSFSDITPRIEAERVLARANEELERRVELRTAELARARDAAERSNRAKSDFLSRMSHELRTPLNAILGFAQLLRMNSAAKPSAEADQLAHIEAAGWHLLELINDVLDLSRIEAGTMVVASAAVELSPLVADCVRMVRGAAKRHEVTLSDATADAPAVAVQADTTRLRQVLVNLLSNACKYNRPGGRVTIEAVRDGAAAVLRVSDTGIGLTARQVAMLYEPFNRLGAEAGVVEGTGIGLVITRGLVDLMGGRLEVESRPGVGSTFSVHLPLAQAAAPSRPETPTAAGAAFEAPGVERTVLYVEDNPSNAKLFTEILARRPHVRVLTAPDAVQGLRVATSRHLDAIVVDISLPGMDGLSLCRRLRELPQLAGTAIVALSANAMDADIARGREAGFDRYFTKPIAVGPFLQWLDEALAVAA